MSSVMVGRSRWCGREGHRQNRKVPSDASAYRTAQIEAGAAAT